MRYLRQGKSKKATIEALEKKYKIKEQYAARLVGDCFRWLNRDIVANPQIQGEMLSVQLIRAEELYSKCLKDKHYKEAVAALEVINKLMKLYSPDVNIFNLTNVSASSQPATIKFKFGGDNGVGGEIELNSKEELDTINEDTKRDMHSVQDVIYGKKVFTPSSEDEKNNNNDDEVEME